MNTPTPEQMRALADGGFGVGASQWHLDATFTLRAAADEVDRLRKVITTNRLLSADERAARATARTAMLVDYVPAEELSRLRNVIENAPHGRACRWLYATSQSCTCWKADVL